MKEAFKIGKVNTILGEIDQVSTIWSLQDLWSTIKVRWSIGRMNYKVEPGLYAVGAPNPNSDLFVTGNYKLSFDHLRCSLDGLNAWILVIDTKGINVWCAAGKGTFGTKEIIYRIQKHQLDLILMHRKIIVPQLGATGVAAHKVKEATGFRVIYGPIRAEDIPEFVSNGYHATPQMREVRFDFWDRAKLIPVDFIYGIKYLLLFISLFFILGGISQNGYSLHSLLQDGSRAALNLSLAYIAGSVITPILLPYIPFTRFSLKGLTSGWIIAFILLLFHTLGNNPIESISWFLVIGTISSFVAMNFTGSSTFTSLSGVQKEMKQSIPLQIIGFSLGVIGWIITRLI